MSNIYVVYKKISDSKYYLVKINDDDSVTAIAELPELATGTSPELVRILTDSDGNVYALKQTESGVNYVHTLYKYNSSGTLQVTKVLAENETFGVITSDYLYTMISNDDEIHKRNLSDLETAETINLTTSHRYYYLCFDSSGYLYTYDRDYSGGAAIVKWELGVGVSESHIQSISSLSAWADWSLLNSFIACDYSQWVGAVYSFAITLDSNAAGWVIDDIPNSQACGIASTSTYMYILGENTADDKLIIKKYDSSKTLISTIEVSSDYITGGYLRFHNAITAYPFAVTVYDYPLAPIVFPAQHKGTPLRMKCMHFEESMSDVCINVNHNVDVTKTYLQLVYGDTTYPESSNFRHVLPSQQLVKLCNKDLTDEDLKAIINNFITNVSGMFTLINENNRLVKGWLDDYAPTEDEHNFADVKMLPITIGKDLDKTMDELFECIEDNVITLNSNLELLKERF